jgi:ssDNA-binding Zn-finger/Zn-ribbon topoisomerase 1
MELTGYGKKEDQMEADMASEINNMIDVFDEILFKHFERLIGSRYGVGELPLNSVTISLIMLLMERENEIESFPSDEIDRYRNETLINDFEELGFNSLQDINIVIEEMVQKDYILVDDDKLIPQKPTISMARLIDLVFPKMPGMNLVAYFVQTMDEVKSKRKDLDSAANQFDQVLQMQGVPLKKSPQQSELSKKSVQSGGKETHIHKSDKSQNISPEKELKTSTILARTTSDNLLDHSKGSFSEPKVLSSDAYKGKIEIKKVTFGKPSLEETESVKDSSDKREPIEDFDEQIPSVDAVAEKRASLDSSYSTKDVLHHLESTEQDKSILDDTKEDSMKVDLSQKNIEDAKVTTEDNLEKAFEKAIFSTNDDDIDKRITAFEEDLSLQCPICKHSKVTVENTATGKSYYKCSNKDCNFISWGKPHHISCPKCNNPFLIEASNKADETILKCPRATCRYRKKARFDTSGNHMEYIESAIQEENKVISISQKPRRKVVRRRVVRRKK